MRRGSGRVIVSRAVECDRGRVICLTSGQARRAARHLLMLFLHCELGCDCLRCCSLVILDNCIILFYLLYYQ